MKREDEIKQAAEQYAWVGDLYDLQAAFTAGATWADANPAHCSVKMIDSQSYSKQQLRDMGFAFDLNGDIIDPKKEHDITVNYVLKKAREWVKNAFVGPFGEGMANSIADEFVKKMKGE